ncbi:MAG: hypothetical protein WCA22_14605 [Candidatus Binatus sp.]
MKIHSRFEKCSEAKSVSRMLVASVMIAVATSAWGCSSRVESRVESSDDWDSSSYASFPYSPGNISDASASVAHVHLGDDSAAGARSGYTDPRWERAETNWERGGEVLSPATNNRVLEVPQMLDGDNTAATIPIPGEGD